MTVGSISTYALFQSTLNDISRTQARLANSQNQLSSGQKSQDFTGIAGQSAQYLNLQAQITSADQFLAGNSIAAARLDATGSSLGQVVDIVTTIKNLIATRRTGVSTADFSAQLNAQWQALTASLNAQSNGQYLFSGTAQDMPSVSSSFPSNTELNDDYYQGSNNDITVRAQEGVEFTGNVRANDPAFQKIFTALALAVRGGAQDNDADLAEAYTLAAGGLQDVITLQAVVNTNKVALENTNNTLTSLKVYWKGLREEIGNADLISISTQVAVDSGLLQAAFQAFAKINSLRLSDYLR